METISKRVQKPTLSETGEHALARYEQQLRIEEDLAPATIRNYLSDLRHFAVWWESIWKQGREEEHAFAPGKVTTPTLTDYRTYLQQELHLKPNSVNRSLISLKRYFAWALSTEKVRHNPAKVAKSVPLHRLAQIMGHDSLDTTKLYVQGTKQDLQLAVETIAWR